MKNTSSRFRKPKYIWLVTAALSVILLRFTAGAVENNEGSLLDGRIRPPVMAGRFYPEDPKQLATAVDRYIENAVKPAGQKPLALISPHAGYVYSGQIAADAFNQAVGYSWDVIVILGFYHGGIKDNASIFPKGGYRTPLGVAEIDHEIAAALLASDDDFIFDPRLHSTEHSIEVQVPFIQRLFPKAKIVPALVCAPNLDLCARFGRALARVLKDRKALIVVSSDLSHYPEYGDAVRVDRNTLAAMQDLNPRAFQTTLRQQMRQKVQGLATCACGEAPILAAMVAAKALGANCGRIISYANSGDAALGGRSRVVGYGAVSFAAHTSCVQDPAPYPDPSETRFKPLTESDKRCLLTYARKTISQYLDAQTAPLPRGFDAALTEKKGAFVTLRKNGKLRGCIGLTEKRMPLCQAVCAMALRSAFNDWRFPEVRKEELPDIDIEISVLTPLRPLDDPADIVVGRDGVILKKKGRSAVFLPHVALQQGWDRTQLLDRLCRKAGLSPGDWKQGARLFVFQAEVFKESDFKTR